MQRFYNRSMKPRMSHLSSLADQAAAKRAGKEAINAAFDLFQRRWTLKIVWELSQSTLSFRDLQAACDNASASVLNVRLSELRAALLVEHSAGAGYSLTDQGRALMTAVAPLLRWAPQWAHAIAVSLGGIAVD
jgi:DNA-binding HxlR family transcriptional regulator